MVTKVGTTIGTHVGSSAGRRITTTSGKNIGTHVGWVHDKLMGCSIGSVGPGTEVISLMMEKDDFWS